MPTPEIFIGTPEDPDTALRQLLKRMVARCPKSRAEIAKEMKAGTGREISEWMLDDWICPSKKPARFPAAFIQAFCEVVGDDALQSHVMSNRLRELVELGERVSSMAGLVREVQERVARLNAPVRRNERKAKRTRKA
jgi:hypothetical protein